MIPKYRCFIDGIGIVGVKAIYFDSEQIILEPFNGVENQYIALEEVELLQSTGLKDKNGVEIYEGDVLEIPVAIDTKKLNGEVVFEDGVFGVKDVLYGWGFEIGLVPLIEIILAKKVIIVGNKYQHPHLLKE